VAGNLGTDSVVVKLDKTAPSITASASGAKGANGWYVGPVKVHFTCSDAMSGIATCPADVTLLNDGANQSVAGTATDMAGNTSSATATGINLDSKAPTVTFGSHPTSYPVDQTVTISCSASDALSGLATTSCQNVSAPASSFLVGGNTVSASATDKAGNVGSASTTFTVTVTPSSLCTITGRFVIDALQARYGQSIPPALLAGANRTVAAICSQFPATIKPAQRAAVIAAFDSAIALATPSLFTPTQAATLTRLAAGL
jgi:hypothetical protein